MPPSAAPERPGSGLTVGASAVQLGGTANAPIAVPRPRAADTAAGTAAELADVPQPGPPPHRRSRLLPLPRPRPHARRVAARSRAAEQTRKAPSVLAGM